MEESIKQNLEDFIENLKSFRGRATELISVYIPAGYDVNTVQKQLEAERSTAKNIKSTSTRKNVLDSLDKIIRRLKEFRKTPPNGLAIFAGDVSPVEGQQDVQLWEVEPPESLNMRLYRCDKEFVLDALEEMLEIGEIYGLLVMDRKEATVGVLEGKKINVLQKMTSGVPSKIRAGGQSSQRFHRITEGLVKTFYKRIAEEMKQSFFDNQRVKGIIVGGPIPSKDEFVDGRYMQTQLQDKVIGVIDIGDADESGLKELVEKSQDLLSKQEIIHEKKLLEKFFNTLGKERERVAYRVEDVKKALQYGAVEVLILSKNIDKQIAKELKTKAIDIGATVEVVSIETPEGEQFFNLSGVGALLRF